MPKDIAVTQTGYLVYVYYDERSINLVSDTQIQRLVRLRWWTPRYLCNTSSDGLLVILNREDYKQTKVVRYSRSTEQQTIQKDDQGKPLYKSVPSSKYLSENRKLEICLADYAARP